MNKFIKIIKGNLMFSITILITIGIMILNPNKGLSVIKNFYSTCKSTVPITILMFALLSLIKIGTNSNNVKNRIQQDNGITSIIFGYIFGFLISGPIYPGFSLSKIFIKCGIKIRVVIIMLSTWATLKLAFLPFEIKILGLHFTIVRWSVTFIAIFLISISCEFIINIIDNKHKLTEESKKVNQENAV